MHPAIAPHAVRHRGLPDPAPIVDANRYRGERASFVRRTAYTRPDGRVVLQRTKTSARDWVYGPPPTPGFVRP